jgi:hypothetical protein
MELGVLSITMLMIVILVIPVTVIKLSTNRKEKQGLLKLKTLAAKNADHISDYDILGNFVIGWDVTTKHLYFYKKTALTDFFEFVDLKTIKAFDLNKQTKRIKNAKESYEILDKMTLSFLSFVNNTYTQIELYDADESYQLTGELELAEKWKNLISQYLRDKQSIDPNRSAAVLPSAMKKAS